MMLSTLIPSYKRPELLLKAIQSFRDTAKDPSCHEAVVRLSLNDHHQEQKDAILERFENCKVLVGEQGNGYHDIHGYYTEMIAVASGEWINIWDDDMTIEGPWDEQLMIAPRKAAILCENYQLGPSWYGRGSLDANATGWFAHMATWKAAGGNKIGFPPDTYMRRFAQVNNWPTHHLIGVTLNHNWQRPNDGHR